MSISVGHCWQGSFAQPQWSILLIFLWSSSLFWRHGNRCLNLVQQLWMRCVTDYNLTSKSLMSSLCVCPAGEKPFNCPSDGCEKTFSSQYSLKSHIRGHDKGQPFSVTLSHPLSEVSCCAAACQCLACWHRAVCAQPGRKSAPCLSFQQSACVAHQVLTLKDKMFCFF